MAIKISLLILIATLLALKSRAEIGGSVVFFDAPDKSYIRSRTLEIHSEEKALTTNEVAAATSVLLGFAPPTTLSLDSSSKLNEVLFPNPFDRPRAVLLLEVLGIKDPLLATAYSNSKIGSTFSCNILGSNRAVIEIADEDEDEVSVTSLDEPLGVECNAACVDKELSSLALWLGGTYTGTPDSFDGKLSLPSSGASFFSLDLSKKSDRHFALSLVVLVKNIKKAVEFHEDFAGDSVNTAELLIGHFTGIEALVEEYGSGDTADQGIALLETTLAKSFELLQKSHRGKIVGVLLSNSRKPSSDSGEMIDVKLSARQSRWLEEALLPDATTIAKVILVRLTLAWTTGIILLVSTLIGVYYLFYMPITRDTLLYSNVKID